MRDVLIIGAGVAGLTAATYLGRFRRRTLVVDGGMSRARWIPHSHNIPGFPKGIGGEQLLERLKAQAQQYGAEILSGQAQSLEQGEAGFSIDVEGKPLQARYVVIATGIEDRLPPLDGAPEALRRSLLRVCPICDAFEAIDRRIAVIGDGAHGEREAQFLRTYSEQVCYLYVGGKRDRDRPQRLRDWGIDLLEVSWNQLRVIDDALQVMLPRASVRSFDVFYCALGCSPRNELAHSLGARCDENRSLQVDAHQRTSVDGLYAAGDIVRGLNQVVVAAAEAALAATDIHNRLRGVV